MNTEKEKTVSDLMKELVDRGRLVEGGWRAYESLTGLINTSDVQRIECRKAFFFGAQHVFASAIGMLDASSDTTALDLERMDKLKAELDAFIAEMKATEPPSEP